LARSSAGLDRACGLNAKLREHVLVNAGSSSTGVDESPSGLWSGNLLASLGEKRGERLRNLDLNLEDRPGR
jgi:hypothetical protein